LRGKTETMRKIILVIGILCAALIAALLYWRTLRPGAAPGRDANVMDFIRHPDEHQDWVIPAGTRCLDAPFMLPTSGFIGYLWGDSFRPGHQHTGLDIFAGTDVGFTPVVAAYDGYLTRLADWKATVILRVPEDPLQPGRQIWLYYTHMADKQGNPLIDSAFPAGTTEVFVKAGTQLGLQGNYSGTAGNPTGVHLHFSIVRDDGQGKFLNELELVNTIDPSPYFNLTLNAAEAAAAAIPLCQTGNDLGNN